MKEKPVNKLNDKKLEPRVGTFLSTWRPGEIPRGAFYPED
jgi:hypothetical protein